MDAAVVANLSAQKFPADTVFGPVVFKLLDAANTVLSTQSAPTGQADTSAQVTFAALTPGVYAISAERQNAGGTAMAAAVVSSPFTVSGAPADITVTVPASVSVSLSG